MESELLKRLDEGENFYLTLVGADTLTLLQPLVNSGTGVVDRETNRIVLRGTPGIHTPWVHQKHIVELDCRLWHKIMFDIVNPRLAPEARFVPSGCQSCWKVVVRPKTVVQLFLLHELQSKMDIPSKCGIERRSTVEGLYGGYFYNLSHEAGEECYIKVREAVDGYPGLGPDVKILLKRACTEYEAAFPCSSTWEIKPHQMEFEKAIQDSLLVKDEDKEVEKGQPAIVKRKVFREWVEFAYENGDMTARQLNGGAPLFAPYETYHNSSTEMAEKMKRDEDKIKESRLYLYGPEEGADY